MSVVIQFHSKAETLEREITAEEEWEAIERLNEEVQGLLRQINGWGRKEERAQNFLRYRFNVSSRTELTIGQMKKAIPMLKETVARCQEFANRMRTIGDAFDTEVVGRGAPWTPRIARKLGRRRMHQEGKNPNWAELLNEIECEIKALS